MNDLPTATSPRSTERQRIEDLRDAKHAEHRALAKLWNHPPTIGSTTPIPTLTARGLKARLTGWLLTFFGCLLSGVVSAITISFGGVVAAFAGGALLAIAIGVVAKAAMRSAFDPFPDKPSSLDALRASISTAVAAIGFGAVVPLALRVVSVEIPDWVLLVSIALVELGLLVAGTAFELKAFVLLGSYRLAHEIVALDEQLDRYDKHVAYRTDLGIRPFDPPSRKTDKTAKVQKSFTTLTEDHHAAHNGNGSVLVSAAANSTRTRTNGHADDHARP